MARYVCPQCLALVSPTASECSNCGRALDPARGPAVRLAAKALVVGGFVGLIVSLAGVETSFRRGLLIGSMAAVLGGLAIWMIARRFR